MFADSMTLAVAQTVIAASIARAEELMSPSSIAVLDTSGRLVAEVRLDGAPLISIDISAAKARTTAFFGGIASADLVTAVQAGGPLHSLTGGTNEHLAFIRGGLALRSAGGALIGTIGVGGGTPDQDVLVAMAGVAALDTTPGAAGTG